ncbi:ribosomal protein S11 (mitochondrion) [Skeletonema marinoi]|mgnify:FL=1|jgi:small subunit ribosomal protein S11|uniref:Ribosomal protein S11 n=1 Tax=Skeletonema marinoi TaxID=267567 RepID=A0AAD8XR56_9STRA|nr:ribosomal protein S11 [Skeletonema marinoi]UBA16313.1 ribosomal protein S11 [Skeletonema marinoi]
MLSLKIANKSFFSSNLINQNYFKHLFSKIKILKFIKKETFSFYLSWLILFTFTKLYHIKTKINYFTAYILFSFFTHQKLISYVINVNLSLTNTLINVNDIKGNPKFFYSAGMFNLQKTQKVRQPKAIITILKSLLVKIKVFRTKPVALHFNNLFFNHQSYIYKKLKRKIFIKLVTSYNYHPHNGCRLKKKKRIKIRTRTKKL